MIDWKPIIEESIKVAESLGHKLGLFAKATHSAGGSVRMASCETCCGCCWIANTPHKGIGHGGRILKYRCGTKEAAGIL